MILINSVDTRKFSLNGIHYLKNYITAVKGDKLEIFNCYERKDILMPLTHYSEFQVNGADFGSVATLQIALVDILYSRVFTAGDTTLLNQNNTGYVKWIPIGYGTSSVPVTRSYFVNSVNATAENTFTVTEQQSPVILYALSGEMQNIPGLPNPVLIATKRHSYIFLGGAGNWGNAEGHTPVTENQFYEMPVQNLQPDDIIENDNTIITALGDIGTADNFLTGINAVERDMSNEELSFYFTYIIDGVLYMSQFIGENHIYGGNTQNSFTENDFVSIANSSQPSATQYVQEFPTLANLPVTGQSDKIYITVDTNILYRWNSETQAYENTNHIQTISGNTVDNTDPKNPVINALPSSGAVTAEYDSFNISSENTSLYASESISLNYGNGSMSLSENGLNWGGSGSLNFGCTSGYFNLTSDGFSLTTQGYGSISLNESTCGLYSNSGGGAFSMNPENGVTINGENSGISLNAQGGGITLNGGTEGVIINGGSGGLSLFAQGSDGLTKIGNGGLEITSGILKVVNSIAYLPSIYSSSDNGAYLSLDMSDDIVLSTPGNINLYAANEQGGNDKHIWFGSPVVFNADTTVNAQFSFTNTIQAGNAGMHSLGNIEIDAVATQSNHAVTKGYIDNLKSEKTITVISDYTLLSTDYICGQVTVYINASASSVTLTLENAFDMQGKTVNIMRVDHNTNEVTITGVNDININNTNELTLESQHQKVTIKSDGNQYYLF